jgi:hypothetical protein
VRTRGAAKRRWRISAPRTAPHPVVPRVQIPTLSVSPLSTGVVFATAAGAWSRVKKGARRAAFNHVVVDSRVERRGLRDYG